jgi:outer membrane protein OmpA-like peptidoglycan-associated protein
VQEDQQAEHASVQQDRQAHAPQEEGQPERASVQEEPQHKRASVQQDRLVHAAEPDSVGADLERAPEDITLDLGQLPFTGAEPTSDTHEQLAAVAERLVLEPGPRLLIEADFNLPDPAARTVVERRVEVVRAILLKRGIAPARLVVRAAGDGPAAPAVTPSVVESLH